jgi:sugar lactone lactonase YvrE
MCRTTALSIVLIAVGTVAGASSAELQPLRFDAEHWQLDRARVTEVDGRAALVGTAYATGIELTDGILEVDVKVPSKDVPSYPGFIFHMASPGDAERVYIRPHRSPLYDDAVHYMPVFHGNSGWQLYSGPGFTDGVDVPVDRWFTLRLEIAGSRARVSVDGTPVLEIMRLIHGARGGGVGLIGPPNGSAVFADFRWAAVDDLDLGPATPVDTPPGALRSWRLSSALPLDRTRTGTLPSFEGLTWHEVTSDPSGLVDISRWVDPGVTGPPTSVAVTTLAADTPRDVTLQIGYSDRVTVFLDGRPVFRGISDYRSRDSSFLGMVGPFDTLYLHLDRGGHELALVVTETFGGWGFMVRDATAVHLGDGVDELWRTSDGVQVPESALYDPEREVVYVSSFDGFRTGVEGGSSLARFDLDGRLLDAEWVGGLTNPTGLAWRDGRVLVVERGGLAEIDPDTASVTARHAIPEGRFLNDITVGPDGSAFVSDSSARVVWRVAPDGSVERWLDLADRGNPNGLTILGDRLMIGLNPNHEVVAVDLADRSVEPFAILPHGLIDGLEPLADGTLLVTHNEGRLFRVATDGSIDKLIDTTVIERNLADLEIVPAQDLVLVPTYIDGSLVAYRVPLP